MDRERNILILFAHLDFQHSKLQRTMIEAVRGVSFIHLNNLLESYPDFYIDVAKERASLAWADLLVFQFPVYWYSTPAIMKHWQDTVLTRGYAYGEGGNALHGKDFLVSVTSGGSADAYRASGIHGRPLTEFFYPLEQMARFCGMNWLSPMALQGGHDLNAAVVKQHAEDYARFLTNYAHGEQA